MDQLSHLKREAIATIFRKDPWLDTKGGAVAWLHGSRESGVVPLDGFLCIAGG